MQDSSLDVFSFFPPEWGSGPIMGGVRRKGNPQGSFRAKIKIQQNRLISKKNFYKLKIEKYDSNILTSA